MERFIWGAAREGFLMQHTVGKGKGAKKGSSTVEMSVGPKAVPGLRGRKEGWQSGAACVPGCWVMLRREKEKHLLL